MTSVEWKDAGELTAYTRQLNAAADAALGDARQVVAKGCLNIKNDARDTVRPHVGGHARAYPSAITYDTRVLQQSAIGEVGPDKERRQGALGNLIEYGSVNNAPIPHLAPAADRELPRFEAALLDLAEQRAGGRP